MVGSLQASSLRCAVISSRRPTAGCGCSGFAITTLVEDIAQQASAKAGCATHRGWAQASAAKPLSCQEQNDRVDQVELHRRQLRRCTHALQLTSTARYNSYLVQCLGRQLRNETFLQGLTRLDTNDCANTPLKVLVFDHTMVGSTGRVGGYSGAASPRTPPATACG